MTGLENNYLRPQPNFQQKHDMAMIAFDTLPTGVMSLNTETNELFVFSPYLESIFTAAENEILRQQGIGPFIEEDRESLTIQWEKSVSSGEVFNKNVAIRCENHGKRWFKVQARMNGSVHTTVFEDVTPQVALQSQLRRLTLKSEKQLTERMNSFAEMSHELKNPLNAITGMTDAILYKNTDPDILIKVGLIQSSAADLLEILDKSLDHAKLQSNAYELDIKSTDIRDSIRNTCKLWEHKALKNGTTIDCQIAHDFPKNIQIDAGKLRQCLNNLLSNAIKFTSYGKITVILKRVEKEGSDPRFALFVRDTGIGMTQAQSEKIFDAYKQADETISTRFGGTGLGMSITKGLVEVMKGEIKVSSKPNEGTIFFILLPLVETEQQASTDAAALNITPPLAAAPPLNLTPPPVETTDNEPEDKLEDLSKLNFLIVDDNETNHFVLNSLLGESGGRIYTAYNGQEALDILSVEKIDIVLMDIHMPVMDGIEATIAIRDAGQPWSNVKIIAVTADPNYQQQRLCLNIGMDAALAKPVKFVKLIDTIRTTMALPDNKLLAKSG